MKSALYVDTMIGTVGDGQIEKSHGSGKTYPGACVPGGGWCIFHLILSAVEIMVAVITIAIILQKASALTI